jgi:hypothetical protein
MKSQITHLNLDERHRRLMAMRSAQLGLSLTEYVGSLIDVDARQSGLVEFLGQGKREEVGHGRK